MKHKSHSLTRKDVILIIYLAAALVLGFFVTVFAIGDIEKDAYQERCVSMNVIMGKMGEHISIAIDSEWDRLHALATRVSRMHGRTVADVCALLRDIQVERGLDFKVVDENGIAYYPDGRSAYWKDHRSIVPNQRVFLLSEMQFGIKGERVMKYIMPLDEPLPLMNTTITYAVLSVTLDSFRSEFNTTNFGEGCLSFIIDENGSFLYENNQNSRMEKAYNLLSYLEKNATFHYGESFDSLEQAILAEEDRTFHIGYQGQNYYMSITSLSPEDWVAVMLVPEENLQSSTVTLTERLTLDLGIIFMCIILIFTLGFLFMWRQTVTRQREAAEAERRSNDAKTTFLSAMSHDIRTPMNAVIGLTELALRSTEPVPKSVRESLEKIRLSSNHLLTLINDILDISKIESGRMPISIAEFSVIKLIGSLANLVRPLAKQKNIDLTIHTRGFTQELLMGDELRINQVYINLVTNAIKYTPAGGRVEIDFSMEPLEEDTSRLRLIAVIKDSGIGMSEAFQRVMYDSFTRETDSRVNTVAGSGLGLTICSQIMRLMDGELDCESKVGVGTTFTASLIVGKGDADTTYVMPKKRILVVDRDRVSTSALVSCAERLGLTLDVANQRSELYDLLEAGNCYDAAFVELGLPKMIGLTIARSLRERFGACFPIIMTDIQDMTGFAKELNDANISVTMSKPYFYRTVYESLRDVFALETKTEETNNTGCDCVLDGMHVLVAEDNDLNWEILNALLEMQGITATWAQNGAECIDALAIAPPNTFEAVLMDVRMPIMDGREATRLIRQSETQWIREIPIVAMTADAFAEDIKACLDAGMDVHLAKPVNMNQLTAVLCNIRNKVPFSGGGVTHL